VINETVLTVREYVKTVLFDQNEPRIDKRVQRFLGKENWPITVIQDALATINDSDAGKVDREAVETFETPTHAQRFRRTMIGLLYFFSIFLFYAEQFPL
jgi:hypothetical protein